MTGIIGSRPSRCWLAALAVAVLQAATAAPVRAACPADACLVDGGEYRAVLPAVPDGAPILVYLHGWGAGPQAALGTAGLATQVDERGYALVAPQGLPRPGRTQADWAVRDGRPHPRDDVAFLRAVIADAAARFGLDSGRVLLAGYSRGGSFVWDVACAAPDLATGFASIAGGFWDPSPAQCATQVHLHHVHGFSDTVVPLEGRILRGPVAQADIFAGLAMWRASLGCPRRADARRIDGLRWTQEWTACKGGSVTLTLHPGGHAVPPWWAGVVLDWFDRLNAD